MKAKGPTIPEVLSGEIQNFIQFSLKNTQVVIWGERINQLFDFGRFGSEFGAEDAILLHIMANSFLTTFLLAAKGHIFHAYAIARVGLDAFFQLAIIHLDREENAKIWWSQNTARGGSQEERKAYRKYDTVFQKQRRRHDYSKLFPKEFAQRLIERWDFFSQAGSHANFVQTIFSLSKDGGGRRMLSGVYDVTNLTSEQHVVISLYLLETYLAMRVAVSHLLVKQGIESPQQLRDIEAIFSDWIRFRTETQERIGPLAS